MSKNCISCMKNERTGGDLLCDECRESRSKTYDSRPDTEAHIRRVQYLMACVISIISNRAQVHDQSKLREPEKSTFDYATPRLAGCTYGSDEYKGFLKELKPALDHHYAANSHHPEHYPWKCNLCDSSYSPEQALIAAFCSGVDGDDHRFCPKCCPGSVIWEAELSYDPSVGINGMSLLDLIEMLCDWKAAGERHKDGSIERSLSVNRDRFNINGQLHRILENTARELGWLNDPITKVSKET